MIKILQAATLTEEDQWARLLLHAAYYSTEREIFVSELQLIRTADKRNSTVFV